jgi:hypothetical protein
MNHHHKIASIVNIGLILFFLTCKTTYRKNLELQLNASSESIAVYAVHEKDLGSVFPRKLSTAALLIESEIDLSPYLSLISFKKNLFSSDSWEPLFKDEEIKEFHELLTKAIKRESAFGYLVLMKKDDPLSPLTKILRNSFLIVKTETGYIFSIPDLNQNLTFATQYKFDDWALYQIPKINSSKKQELKIKPNQLDFSLYKEITSEGHNYYERIMIIKDKKFLPDPLVFRMLDSDELEVPLQNKPVIERLKTLEELRKNGLITEEEYRLKKVEIIKDI